MADRRELLTMMMGCCCGQACITVTIACGSAVFGKMTATVTVMQGLTTVATGTTDATTGQVCFTLSPSTSYSWSAVGNGSYGAPRYGTASGGFTTNASGAASASGGLPPGANYICCPAFATFPIAKTLAYTDSSGAHSLVWQPGSQVWRACWSISETVVTGPASRDPPGPCSTGSGNTSVTVYLNCGGGYQSFHYGEDNATPPNFLAYSQSTCDATTAALNPSDDCCDCNDGTSTSVAGGDSSTMTGIPSGYPLSFGGSWPSTQTGSSVPMLIPGAFTVTE